MRPNEPGFYWLKEKAKEGFKPWTIVEVYNSLNWSVL